MSILVKVLRTVARLALTLFVLGQLVFLVSSNFLGVEKPLRTEFKNFVWGDPPPEDVDTVWNGFKRSVQQSVKDSPAPEYFEGTGPIHETYYDKTTTYTKHWSQLTGQPQNWSLFAPYIVEVVPFPAVELRWDDQDWPDWAERPLVANPHPAPVVILSDNEPTDRREFAHYQGFRFRKYEGNLTPYASAEDGRFDPETSAWRKKIKDRVDDEPVCMHNYLRWRLKVYAEAHPGLPRPTQVILLVRTFKIPKPPGPPPWNATGLALGSARIADAPRPPGPEAWYWYDLGEDRVARWLPGASLDTKDYEPVERYDPVSHHFERVGK